MAQLSSPGVSVTVIDESFYTPAAPGTTPLIIVASAQDKRNGAGTGVAPGTLKANAGKVYLLTSQKDLSDTFGIPVFKTDANNNPVHAGEQNEYGLEAAYSFLGVSNRAYVVRADVNLASLNASGNAPTSAPNDGVYWFDTADTHFGIFEWNANAATVTNGQTFQVKNVTVITDSTKVDPSTYAPLPSVGAIGDYAVVAVTTLNKLWYKKPVTDTAAGIWVAVGDPTWKKSWPAATGNIATPTLLSGDALVVNGYSATGVTTLSALVTAIGTNVTGVTAAVINGYLNLYSTGVDIVISGSTVAKVGLQSSTYRAPALTMSPHYQIPTYSTADGTAYGTTLTGGTAYPSGSVWVKTTNSNLGASWIVKKYNAATSAFITKPAMLYANNQSALYNLDPTGGGINLAIGTTYVKYNDDEGTPQHANFKIYGRAGVGATTLVSNIIGSGTFTAGSNTFTLTETTVGSASLDPAITVTFTAAGTASDANTFLTAFTAAMANSKMIASLNANNSITITHIAGGDFHLVDGTSAPISKLFSVSTTSNFYLDPTSNGSDGKFLASLWTSTVAGSGFAPASATPPTNIPTTGTLWYNSTIDQVDIMVHDGTRWVGYLNYTQNAVGGTTTDPAGPIVSATQPTLQSDGTPLAHGDLWISTADLESYPQVYKYNYLTKKWVSIDTADQETQNGILFHDARWTTGYTVSGGSTIVESANPSPIKDLLASNFVDFDAPDPALYPKGMLLWNLRRSGFNVVKFVQNYVDTTTTNPRRSGEQMTNYYPHRWISEAANQENGAGTFGRKAQRKVVVQALDALINSNQQIRDEESRIFNLIACPGYPETIQPLVGLNYDRGLSAFVLGDAPARLTPDATTLQNWGSNVNRALDNGEDGLVTTDPYLGVFYPWGYTTDLLGNNAVVPPTHMMLRTIALSDNVSYPWFAPAGTRRGGITNASSVGYVDPHTGEFHAVALNTGQRDTLQGPNVHVNPITYLTGTGLVNYGQQTRQLTASSLDRINVARLVIYLRRQFAQLAKPYIFEPNDTITRNEIKQAAENLLLELVGQRAIYDFLVVCDTSNNTPARIDRSELYLDVAIEPVKAVEFIYIPLRLKNTGAIKGLGGK
jgi:hypothetical protein